MLKIWKTLIWSKFYWRWWLSIVGKKRDPGILDPELFLAQIRKVEARLGKLAKIRKVETD